MIRITEYYKNNTIYIAFSYIFTFFLICSFIFGHGDGFGSFTRLLLTLFVTAAITPITAYIIIKLPKL